MKQLTTSSRKYIYIVFVSGEHETWSVLADMKEQLKLAQFTCCVFECNQLTFEVKSLSGFGCWSDKSRHLKEWCLKKKENRWETKRH